MNKITIKDVLAFIQGHIRYYLWGEKRLSFLIRPYIKEQIIYRINSMNKECYSSGACIECGCRTIHLQMAAKACEGNCYPEFVSKKVWESRSYIMGRTTVFKKDTTNKKFTKVYEGK